MKQLAQANEKAWGTLGGVSRSMENEGQATECYERALVHNPYSPSALAGLGGVYKSRGDYRKVGVVCNVVCVSFPGKRKKHFLPYFHFKLLLKKSVPF